MRARPVVIASAVLAGAAALIGQDSLFKTYKKDLEMQIRGDAAYAWSVGKQEVEKIRDVKEAIADVRSSLLWRAERGFRLNQDDLEFLRKHNALNDFPELERVQAEQEKLDAEKRAQFAAYEKKMAPVWAEESVLASIRYGRPIRDEDKNVLSLHNLLEATILKAEQLRPEWKRQDEAYALKVAKSDHLYSKVKEALAEKNYVSALESIAGIEQEFGDVARTPNNRKDLLEAKEEALRLGIAGSQNSAERNSYIDKLIAFYGNRRQALHRRLPFDEPFDGEPFDGEPTDLKRSYCDDKIAALLLEKGDVDGWYETKKSALTTQKRYNYPYRPWEFDEKFKELDESYAKLKKASK